MEIHKGDKIRFKIATVTRVYDDGHLRVNYGLSVVHGVGDVDGWTHDVEEVIPAPRPLAVGDLVSYQKAFGKLEVRAVENERAWCKVIKANMYWPLGSYVTLEITRLTRA